MTDSKEQVSTSRPPTPPNGGTRAWLQVLGSFLVFFNISYSQAKFAVHFHANCVMAVGVLSSPSEFFSLITKRTY